MKIFTIISFVLLFSFTLNATTYTSTASGNWSTMTWSPAGTPGPTDDVIIGAGHIVIVDVEASCNDISFADANAKLGLNASLYIYGDFYRFDTSVNPFYSGTNLWTPGMKMIFTGSAAVQTVFNLGTTSSSPFPLRFDELVIDKSAGKFTTGTGNYKLGIGTSLEVKNGSFELGSTDDIEGRDAAGTATTPDIIVRAGAVFDMIGNSSVIRRGNFTGDETGKINKLIVFGTAYLVFGTTSGKINFTGIDIENGGYVDIPLGRGTVSSAFNSGIITIKNGGKLKNNLNTAFWYSNPTVPPSITINSGGEYEASSSATTLPPGGITQNDGSTIRFSFGGAITLPTGISNYKTLILSNSGLKSLGTTTNIEEYFQLSGTATLGLGSFSLTYSSSATLRYGASGQSSAQTTSDAEWPASGGPNSVQIYNTGGVTLHDNRAISGTLSLTVGQFDNNSTADDKVLTMGNGATISRARGTLSSVPSFGSSVNLRYTSSIEHVTTGFEMPTSSSVLTDLTIQTTQGITLGADVTVNGTLALTSSSITLGANDLTLGSSATISGSPSVSNMIIADGSGEMRKEFSGAGSFTFPVGDNTGTAEYSPITLDFTSGTFSSAYAGVNLVNSSSLNFALPPTDYINRRWVVSQSGISSFSCDVKFVYDQNDVVGNENLIYLSKYDGFWSIFNITNTSTNELTGTVNSFSEFTGADLGATPVELSAFNVSVKRNSAQLTWKTITEVNSYIFEVQRKSENAEWIKVGEVSAAGNSNSPKAYSFADMKVSVGKSMYRLKMVDADGRFQYSNLVEAEIELPNEYAISQNYPNPFNPSTKIDYQLPFDSKVTMELYGITGEKIATLINSDLSAGYYTTDINASAFNLASGVFIYKMTASNQTGQNFVQVKKLMLTK